jgi:hypothetical protein
LLLLKAKINVWLSARGFFYLFKIFAQYIYSNTLEGEKDLHRGACLSFSFLNAEVT